jgi:hypothetical protein
MSAQQARIYHVGDTEFVVAGGRVGEVLIRKSGQGRTET